MSHELRTPLNGIIGFSQLLQTDDAYPLAASQQSAVSHIVKSGQHFLGLIDQVLDLSRIEQGQITASIASMKSSEVIEECLGLIGQQALMRNLRIEEVGLDADTHPLVMADRGRLKQVLLNLLMNAVKYTTSGEWVRIRRMAGSDGFLRFEGSDDGPGIQLERQQEVFEPFNRLGAETKDIEGNGIGLTITRQLVIMMGGKIDFESSQETGTRFWFELPLASEGEQAIALKQAAALAAAFDEAKPAGQHHASLRQVLYVEDNPANTALMAQIINRLKGVEMVHAHTAEIGLAMAKLNPPDLIILDINLPGMSGIEALGHLRNIPETRSTPAIAISAAAMPHDVKRALDAGFGSYLTKPIDVVETAKVIENALKEGLRG